MSGKGNPKTGGRTKGQKNKVSELVRDRLKELKCDPIEQLVIIARQAQENDDLHLAGAMYKELAAYVAPKLKSIDLVESVATPEPLNVTFARAANSAATVTRVFHVVE
jgi:hypothetical protein